MKQRWTAGPTGLRDQQRRAESWERSPARPGVPASALADRGVAAPVPVAPVRAGRTPVMQAKLRVNVPGDRFEQEADRVADTVVAGGAASVTGNVSTGSAQRACAECEAEEERKKETMVQRSASAAVSGVDVGSAVSRGTSGAGEALPGPVRGMMERGIGADFGGVRVHRDASAAESARMLNARAYTVGSDVVFGAGEYRPESKAGQRLLAHELAHVVQQEGGERRVQREDKPLAEADVAIGVIPATSGEWKTADVVLVQVHGDEPESLRAAMKYQQAGRRVVLIYVKHSPNMPRTEGEPEPVSDRCVNIRMTKGGGSCWIDPNRMFPTPEGDAAPNPQGKEIAPGISQTTDCTRNNSSGCIDNPAIKAALLTFRQAFLEKIDEVRKAILERRREEPGGEKMTINDVPIFYLHNNDNENDARAGKFRGLGWTTYQPVIEAGKPHPTGEKDRGTAPKGFAFAVDQDDFVLVTSLTSYLDFTGDTILDVIEEYLLHSALSDEVQEPWKASIAELRTTKPTRAHLEAFVARASGDAILGTLGIANDPRIVTAMKVARLFNATLQPESRAREFAEHAKYIKMKKDVVKRDGSSSVYFRNARFINYETESLKGGQPGAKPETQQAYQDRYEEGFKRLLDYLGA